MKQFDIPILFIIFNKLESTKRVFNEIRKVKPEQLFIVADGPRNNEEKKETDKIRKYILKNIDWPCKIEKIFRKENLGGDKSSVNGLDWFFKNVEYGIFLEDDDLPSESFFKYHRELLLKYKNNPRIKSISGVNFLRDYKTKESYLFSKIFFSCWGFSTWRRAWGIDEEYIKKTYKKNLKKMVPNLFLRLSLKKKIKYVLNEKIQGWDYLFLSKNALLNGLTIVPKVNLIENIGFDIESTHKFNKVDKKYLKIKRKEMDFPLIHPKKVEDNKFFNFLISLYSFKKIAEKKIKFFK